jgi:hypothetical protein
MGEGGLTRPMIEFAGSAKCKRCWNKLKKGELRVGSEPADATTCFHHVECWAAMPGKKLADASTVDGFDQLDKEQQTAVKKALEGAELPLEGKITSEGPAVFVFGGVSSSFAVHAPRTVDRSHICYTSRPYVHLFLRDLHHNGLPRPEGRPLCGS